MPLKFYRRHRKECEAGHVEDYRTGEFDEGRRGWKRCACRIHVAGTLGRCFGRKNTGAFSWDEARRAAKVWEDAGNWEGIVHGPQEPTLSPAVAPPPPVKTTEEAVTMYLTEVGRTAQKSTIKRYRLLLKKLANYGLEHEVLTIDHWTTGIVRECKNSWNIEPQTLAKNMSTIKAFFEYCVECEWITKNPARPLKNPRGRDARDKQQEQKLPFTDEELRRMYDGCVTKYGKTTVGWRRKGETTESIGTVSRNGKWGGSDLADFIALSTYTGLRISDVCTFTSDKLSTNGEIQLRTTKAGTHVFVWIPEWLQERIRERSRRYGTYIFGEHQTDDLNIITEGWRRRLNVLWELAGFPMDKRGTDPSRRQRNPHKPTPHRFRHTFARILLQRPGVTVRDVAELLGNTEQMVRKHYAAWIPERQERLTRVLKEAFADHPQPGASTPPEP